MPFFTTDEVTQAAFDVTDAATRSAFEGRVESYFEQERLRTLGVTSFDIFLSHAYADQLVVTGLYAMLTSLGFVVYIDWIFDRQLNRTAVTAATAAVLRQRMAQSKSLVYATTVNHSSSKWMPWECGYFDGHDGHTAILPVVAYSGAAFSGQEYLGLYPYGQRSATGKGRTSLRIHNQNNLSRSVTFDKWIGGVNP